MSGKPGLNVSYIIPSPPDVFTVAAAASDEKDPIAAIQEAVDAHHAGLAAIIENLQRQVEAAAPSQAAASEGISKADDKAKAMRFLKGYTKDMSDVRKFDPNTQKGNYIGNVIHLTDYHLIQQVGAQTFVVHDRTVIGSDLDIVENERLHIKYSRDKITVNEVKGSRGHVVNAEVKRNISADKQQALAKAMQTNADSVREADQDQEHEA